MSFKFNVNCLKVSTVVVFMLLLQPLCAQQSFAGLEQIARNRHKNFETDVILTVATKDTIIYQKSPKLFTAKTQMPLGEASQLFTAALIMLLADEGKLSLDDKVSSYLPVFEKYGKNYITLRHCLTHFTGIRAETKLKLFEKKKWNSLEEEVAAHAAKEIETNPGTAFQYSLIGPAIAARVAEVVMKKKFDLLIQQKLFRPLGMRQTSFSTLDASAVNAATGARTTAADYTRFLRMLLNGGKHNGQQILTEIAVKELRTISAPANDVKNVPEETKGFNYAAGAWVATENNTKQASVLIVPGSDGVLSIVDFCREYAFLMFVKDGGTVGKEKMYAVLKETIDVHFSQQCK